MQLDDVYVDTASDVKILIHHPTPTYNHGAAFPTVDTRSGGLTDTTYVISYYEGDGNGVNVMDGTPQKVVKEVDVNGTNTAVNAYRICKVVASSAILAAPGAATGELLIGYPFTSVSTSQADERMRVQLRCYLGSVLYQPDNVIVMPNCHIDGIVEEQWVSGTLMDAFLETFATKTNENSMNTGEDLSDAAKLVMKLDRQGAVTNDLSGLLKEMVDMKWQFMPKTYYHESCRGAQYNDAGKLIQPNNAEFGRLDHFELYMGLHGVPATYENADFDRRQEKTN